MEPQGLNSNGTPFKLTHLATWTLKEDDRIRVTFTWDSCPGNSALGSGPPLIR